MKKLFLLILFILFDVSAQQSAKIIYETDQAKIPVASKSDIEMNQLDKELFQISKLFTYVLEFNKQRSLYYVVEPLEIDDIPKYKYTLAKLLGGLDSVYQDKKTKLIYKRIDDEGKIIFESDSLYKKWHITGETGTYMGFRIIKAIRGRNEAWFTPDIPVPFGPYGIGGLPGLILKFQFGPRIIKAKSISFYKKPIKIKNVNGKIIPFEIMKKKRMEEMMKIMKHQR